MTLLRQLGDMFLLTVTEGPEYLAWRLDAWTTRVMDERRLSVPVYDAWWRLFK